MPEYNNNRIVEEEELCSVCGSRLITDDFNGELLCSSCGVVIKEKVETMSPQWRSFSSSEGKSREGGFPSSLLIYDTGLSTYIGSINSSNLTKQTEEQNSGSEQEEELDVTSNSVYVHKASCPIPVNRLRKLNAMSISSAPVSRNLKRATWELNRVGSALGLSWQIAERSAYFYRKALQKNLIKGRSIAGFVTAAIYLACKERNVPRTVDEISRAAAVDKPFAIHCYKILVDEMQIEPPITDPFRNIAKISDRAGIEERIARRAMEILSSVSNHTQVTGKNPVVLAAAALYLASTEHNLGFTKTTIADAAEISTISLRKRLADITQALESTKGTSCLAN